MTIEEYKQLMIELVEKSEDVNYIIAVYSFAAAYPDETLEEK